jgi:fibronectin type 3 domain-containing protein
LPLLSHYRSKQEFLASLSPWRRQLANLNWHPTVDMKVQSYAPEQQAIEREQRMKQLRKENARLAAINSRLDHFEHEHFSSLNQALSTGDS